MKGYKPFGMSACKMESVILKIEEFESIRLVNYEMLPQELAATKMNVSRPTFTRIYNRALKQVAISFVEGRTIEIEGGNYEFETEWYRCRKCFRLIKGLENHKKCENCIQYGDDELICLGKIKCQTEQLNNNQKNGNNIRRGQSSYGLH